jgi:hypothetical protein
MEKAKKGSIGRLVVGRCAVCGEPVHAGGDYQMAGPGQVPVCLLCLGLENSAKEVSDDDANSGSTPEM